MTLAVQAPRSEEDGEKSRGIIVLGMHRAGTSTITSVLANLGFELPGEPIPASWDNPKGYWEPREVVESHDAFLHSIHRSWSDPRPLHPRHFEGAGAKSAVEALRGFVDRSVLPRSQWVLKDPRMCRLLPLWRSLLDPERIDLHILLIIRSPLAVAASLQKRDGFSTEKSLLLWLRHYLEVEAATRDYDRNSLHFEGLATSSSSHAMQPIWAATGIPRLPVKRLQGALESAIDRSLVHWEFGQEETIERLQDFPWVATAYQALDLLGTDRDREARAKLDQIRSELNAADRLLFHDPTVVEAEKHGERYFRLLQEMERYHRSVEAQRREIESQRAEIDEMRKAFALVRESDQEAYAELARRDRVATERQESVALALRDLKNDLLQTSRELQLASVPGAASSPDGGEEGQIREDQRALSAPSWDLERVEALFTDLESLRDGLGGPLGERLQALDEVSGGLARLEDYLTQRLDQRHLHLLTKSLEVSSQIEAGWTASKAELDEMRESQAKLTEKTSRLEIQAIQAEASREAADARLAAAEAERQLATLQVEEIRGQLEAALVHRAEAMAQRDQVLHERAVRAENQRQAAEEASAQRDAARSELERTRQEMRSLRSDLKHKDQELTQILGRRSWKVTAPLRALYGLFQRSGSDP